MKLMRIDPVLLARLGQGTGPKWCMVMPYGTKFRGDFTGGRWDFDVAKAQAFVANFKKLKARYHGADAFGLQVNYHHLGGEALAADVPLGNTVACGWIEDLEARSDGLYGLIRWTSEARQLIQEDKFRYLSPEFYEDVTDRDTGQRQGPTIVGAALTNTPLFSEMPRVAASDVQPEAAPAAQEGVPHMDKKKLCARLGLPETATDEQIEAKLEELKTASTKAPAVADESKAIAELRAQVSQASGQTAKLSELVTASNERVATLETENKALKAADAKREAEGFVDGLVKEGKIVPIQREEVLKLATQDLALAKSVYAKAAKVVHMAAVGADGGPVPTPDSPEAAQAELSAAAEKIAKEKGIKLADARDQAIAKHPELARKSWRHTSPSRAS